MDRGREDLNLRPPGSEPCLGFFEFRGRKRDGEVFCFQRLAITFIGADSRKLKMRRLLPTDAGQNQN
jgi:hypothetical protein